MSSWDDATFFSRMGLQQPRTGAVGVPNNGGLAASQPLPGVRPVTPPSLNGAPVGRPEETASLGAPEGSSVLSGAPAPARGAPAEMTFKFHEPAVPEAPEAPEPVENPLGTPIETQTGSALMLSEEGRAAHAGARLQAEELFGSHPFAGDPHAPKPVLRAGKANYNPFQGWS